MRLVHIASQNRHVKIGGSRLPRHAPAGPRLKDFLHAHAAYPSSPSSVDWTAPAMSVIENIEGNDTLGDCVIAEDAHYIAVLTGNANKLFAYSAAQTIADYSAIAGYVPGDESTDQGTDPIAAMTYRVQHGYADGSKDAGYALVDCSNPQEVEYAVNAFGNLKLWFGIPESIVQNMPQQSGFVWDVDAGAPNPRNGHCIGTGGYNPASIKAVATTKQGVLVLTWGMLGLVTWEALAAWFVPSAQGGAAVRISQDWVSKASGNTPSGLELTSLVTAFNLYFGGQVPVPTPTPSPTPPAPAPPGSIVTLAQAQAWVTAALAGGFPLMTRATAESVASQALAANWPASS